jgi:hypothetical protein
MWHDRAALAAHNVQWQVQQVCGSGETHLNKTGGAFDTAQTIAPDKQHPIATDNSSQSSRNPPLQVIKHSLHRGTSVEADDIHLPIRSLIAFIHPLTQNIGIEQR